MDGSSKLLTTRRETERSKSILKMNIELGNKYFTERKEKKQQEKLNRRQATIAYETKIEKGLRKEFNDELQKEYLDQKFLEQEEKYKMEINMLKSFNKLKSSKLEKLKNEHQNNQSESTLENTLTMSLNNPLTPSIYLRPSSLEPKREYPYLNFSRVRTELTSLEDYYDLLEKNKNEYEAEYLISEKNNKMIDQLSKDLALSNRKVKELKVLMERCEAQEEKLRMSRIDSELKSNTFRKDLLNFADALDERDDVQAIYKKHRVEVDQKVKNEIKEKIIALAVKERGKESSNFILRQTENKIQELDQEIKRKLNNRKISNKMLVALEVFELLHELFLTSQKNMEKVNQYENIEKLYEEMTKRAFDSENQPYYLVARIDSFLAKFDLKNLIMRLIQKLNELKVKQTTLHNRYTDLTEEKNSLQKELIVNNELISHYVDDYKYEKGVLELMRKDKLKSSINKKNFSVSTSPPLVFLSPSSRTSESRFHSIVNSSPPGPNSSFSQEKYLPVRLKSKSEIDNPHSEHKDNERYRPTFSNIIAASAIVERQKNTQNIDLFEEKDPIDNLGEEDLFDYALPSRLGFSTKNWLHKRLKTKVDDLSDLEGRKLLEMKRNDSLWKQTDYDSDLEKELWVNHKNQQKSTDPYHPNKIKPVDTLNELIQQFEINKEKTCQQFDTSNFRKFIVNFVSFFLNSLERICKVVEVMKKFDIKTYVNQELFETFKDLDAKLELKKNGFVKKFDVNTASLPALRPEMFVASRKKKHNKHLTNPNLFADFFKQFYQEYRKFKIYIEPHLSLSEYKLRKIFLKVFPQDERDAQQFISFVKKDVFLYFFIPFKRYFTFLNKFKERMSNENKEFTIENILSELKELNEEAFASLKENMDFFFGNYQKLIVFIRKKQVEAINKLLSNKNPVDFKNLRSVRFSLTYFNSESVKKLISDKINDYRNYFDDEKMRRLSVNDKNEKTSIIKKEGRRALSMDDHISKAESENEDEGVEEIREEIKRTMLRRHKGDTDIKKEDTPPHYMPQYNNRELQLLLQDTVKNSKEISKLISSNKRIENEYDAHRRKLFEPFIETKHCTPHPVNFNDKNNIYFSRTIKSSSEYNKRLKSREPIAQTPEIDLQKLIIKKRESTVRAKTVFRGPKKKATLLASKTISDTLDKNDDSSIDYKLPAFKFTPDKNSSEFPSVNRTSNNKSGAVSLSVNIRPYQEDDSSINQRSSLKTEVKGKRRSSSASSRFKERNSLRKKSNADEDSMSSVSEEENPESKINLD